MTYRRVFSAGMILLVALAAVVVGSMSKAASGVVAPSQPKVGVVPLPDDQIGLTVFVQGAKAGSSPELLQFDGLGHFALLDYDRSKNQLSRTPFSLTTSETPAEGVFAAQDSAGRIWVAAGPSLGFLDNGKTFHAVQVPARQATYPSTAADLSDSDSAEWDNPPYTAMTVLSDGRIALARDRRRSILLLDPASASFTELAAPSDVNVPAGLYRAGDELLVYDRRPSTRPAGKHDYRIVSVPQATWRSAPSTDAVVLGDGQRLWFQRKEGEPLSFGAEPNGESIAAKVAPAGLLQPIAVGENGDAWYLRDGTTVSLVDGATGRVTDYALPKQPDLGVSVPFGAPTPKQQAYQPLIVSSVIDSGGDLWLSYIVGFTRVVVLDR
jgi:hypothetical protein